MRAASDGRHLTHKTARLRQATRSRIMALPRCEQCGVTSTNAGMPRRLQRVIRVKRRPIVKRRRCGLDGEEILVYKFRRMSVCEDGAVISQALKDGRRVTPAAGSLRRTPFDERGRFSICSKTK